MRIPLLPLVVALGLLVELEAKSQSVVLSNAVDAPQLTWTTGGSQNWIGQTNTTFDGVDAAQSGLITHSQESWLQTTVVGPANLSFRWKVSSEAGYDYLEFYINGVLQSGRISGNVDWQGMIFLLNSGPQTLRWRYAKDNTVTAGQDRGWVDTVVVVLANGPPTILTPPASKSAGYGDAVTFNVGAAGELPITYAWQRGGIALTNEGNISGVDTAGLSLFPVSKLDEGSFNVIVSNSLGSVTSVVATLTVNDPYITQQPTDVEANAGVFVSLGVYAAGTEPLSYQWYHDGVAVAAATAQFLELPNPSKADAGLYRAVVTNSFGSVTSAVVTLSVHDPFITQNPGSSRRNVGESGTIEVQAGGTPPLTYQWQLNGAMISNATNEALVLTNLLASDAGVYSVVVSNASGSVTSAPAVLTVNAVTLDNAISNGLGGNFDTVHSMAVQPDGRILVGGNFVSMAGQPRTNIARLNPDGTLDGSFNPAVGQDFNQVNCLALQTDGKILVGGQFSSIAGQTRNNLGRLDANGTLDDAFNPGVVAGFQGVYCLAVQPDGKILVGGSFSSLGGQSRTNLGRLNADGTPDLSFNPDVDGQVYCLAMQPDGKILVGGYFETLAGQARGNIGRLNTNGTLDVAFNPQASGPVLSMALQPDGKILLAGNFDTLGGQVRNWIGRINAAGTLDATFNPVVDYSVDALALQADGKILLGGNFYNLNGQVREGLGRLNADGTLDLTFNPSHNGQEICLTLQPDGKVLVGGRFTSLSGQPRNGIGRLLNTDPATQSLDRVSSTVTWLRGGTSPEVWRTTFDYSVDGFWWTNVGAGTRLTGGWQVTGATLPPNVTLRARGHVSGDDKGSSWLVEKYQGKPVLVAQPASHTNNFGSSTSLFAAAGGSEPVIYQWWKNGIALVNSGNISGANTSSLTLTNLSKVDEGGYTLVASNAFGSVTSLVATLVVRDPFITQQPVGADLNTGTNVTFQVLAGGTPLLSYLWFRNEAAVLGATNSSLTLSNLSVADAGFYTAVVSGPQGSITSAPALLTVRPPLYLNPTPASTDSFGQAVAALGSDRLIIGDPDDDLGATDSGTVYLFSTNRVLLTTITNPRPALEDHFGYSVAAVGNDLVLVGAWGDNTGASDAGAAYLYDTNGTLLTTITNPTPQSGESFGISVAAVGIDAVLIGAYFENNTSGFASGAAYLYSTNGTLLTTFINPTPGPGDYFGWSVAALGGDKVLIGALDDNGWGTAYLFRTDGTLLSTFTNPTPRSDDNFGYALTGVGSDRVLISARTDNTGGANAGAAYLFNTNGTLLTTFTNPTPSSLIAFGQSVASLGEDHVLIGAHLSLVPPASGRVFMFTTAGTLVTNIADPNPISGGWFGYALAVLGSNKAIVGAPDTATGGEAYLINLPLASPTGPASIFTHPLSLTVIQDSPVTLRVVAGGAPPLSYQWLKDTLLLAGATNNTYAIPSAQTSDAGTYSVVVSNALGSATSSNAVLSVLPWVVLTQSISFNETAYGRIESSNRLDYWNFSALAGQQITFDLLNASAAGLRFDLRGPSGWTGFSNLTTDSGLVNLPANGDYTLVARGATGVPDIAYAFKLIESTQTDLPLGTNFIGQFTGNAQAQIFKITVTNSGPLRISLVNAGTGNRAELYASRIVPPTRGTFEQQSATGPGASRELFIPNASVGTLYILVYGDSIPTPGQFTIRANSPGVVLSAITPNRQPTNASFAMTLTGAGFEQGDLVELVAGGGSPTYAATNVSLDTYSQLSASFPPSLATAGTYSVRVTQLDGDTAMLTNVFNLFNVTSFPGGVTFAGSGPKLETRLILPGELGRGAPATLYVEYANTGSSSMEAPLLILKSSDPDGSDRPILSLDQSRLLQSFWSAGLPPGTSHEIFILASGAQPGVLNPGERRRVPVHYLGLLEPWNTADTKVELQIRYWTADDTSPIDWTARKASLRPPTLDSATWNVVYANLTSGLTNTGAYVQMLGDNASYLGRLGQTVTDVDELWNFELQQAWGYTPLPVLDSVTDASMPAPGVALEFSRRFSSNVRSRNSTGPFGRGWFTAWQSRLVVETNADLVRLVGEAGSASVFTRDTRLASRYFSGAGDSSSLTNLGGGIFQLREPSGTVTRFRADGFTDYVQDVNGNRVTAGYDGAGKITSLTHTSGGSITIGYNGSGLISSIADSAGRTNTYTYSANYLQTVTTSDGKVTSYTYETGGNNAQRHALKSITRGGTTRSYTFDTRGRMASAFVASGEQLVNFTYDSAGGVYTTDASGTTSLFYDQNGQLAKTRDPLGNITTSEFDSELRLKRLVTPTGESQSFTWCNCGSPASITDELGHTTKFAYDNPFRRLTSLTDAKGNNTRYTYNTNGNLLATIYPNNSAEVFGGYTPEGLPLSYTNRRSQPITYTYTPAGQISRQSFTNGSYNDFFYDLRGNLTNVTEHPAGGTNKVTIYLYDYATAGDRLRKVTYPNARWVEFFYDGFGRRDRMTDVTGQDLRYAYDSAGRLWRLRDATNAVIVEYLYNTAGRLQRINKGNGTYTTYDYDAAGQILHLVNYAPNSSVNSRFDYTYDKRGRRTSMGTVDGDWTYNYDATGQLIRAQLASTNPQIPNQTLQYNYDALGNRTTTLSNGVTTIYVPNNLNQYTMVGGVAYQYDADGNLTFDGIRNHEYDVQNRLVRVTGPEGVTEYEYDAAGSRTATVFNGQRTEYLLDPTGLVNVFAEHDGGGNLLARNVHGLGLVGRSLGMGLLNFMDFEALGSTATVTDFSGAVVNRYAYQPFGSLMLNTEAVANPFRFVGQHGVTHESNHLQSMRMRFYNPVVGRFVTVDPSRMAGGDVNLYNYTKNSAMNLIDPQGLEWWSISASGLVESFVSTVAVVATVVVAAAVVVTLWPVVVPAVVAAASTAVTAAVTAAPAIITAAYIVLANPVVNRAVQDIGTLVISSSAEQTSGAPPNFRHPIAVSIFYMKTAIKLLSAAANGPAGAGLGEFGDENSVETANSTDPNEKFGARGIGLQNWVPADAVIPYRINFENLSSATAPAQEVVITDQLSTNLNWETFQLTELGFGDFIIPVPPGLQYYETTVQMTCCGDPFEAQIEAGLNAASGELRVVFRSINPATSLPPPVSVGFLPPEDGTGRGQGHVSYLINAKTNLPTGTPIRNVALITFDRQQSIATDQIDPLNPGAGIDPNKQALNTIDAGIPSSSVAALPAESSRSFMVNWSGQDDAGGSGIASYDVYVNDNGTNEYQWLSQTTNSGARFVGRPGHAYSFFSAARDQVGNVEPAPGVYDAQTMVPTNAPWIAQVDDQLIPVEGTIQFTNTLQGVPAGAFVFSLGPDAPSGATLNSTNGAFLWTPRCNNGGSTNLITIEVVDTGATNMVDSMTFTVVVEQCLRPLLGSVIIPAGQRGRLPVNLVTTAGLTNLIATLALPPARLTDPQVEPSTDVCTTGFVTDLGGGSYLITLNTCTGTVMTGSQQVAWLNLMAVTNQSSAFVSIQLANIVGTSSVGVLVSNIFSGPGRVIILGDEPLLETYLSTNRQPSLLLYGLTNRSFTVESTTDLLQTNWWSNFWQGTMTNLFRPFEPVGGTNNSMHFRARPEPGP